MFCQVVFDVPLDRGFDYTVPDVLAQQVIPGVRVTAPFGTKLTVGLVIGVSEISAAPSHISLKPIAAVLDERPLFGSDLFPLLRFMKSHWGGPIGQILFALIPPQPAFKVLPPPAVAIRTQLPDFAFTPSQQHALTTVRSLAAYQFGAFLLTGPAYTGKTQTVLHLAADVLNGYGQALITVPDIVAARQFIQRATALFGEERVYCWHSRTLVSRKKQYFSDISSGVPCVVIATRSGVLLPFKNLRLAAM